MVNRYPYFLAAMATLYTVEPLLTRVYITNVCTAGEKVVLLVSHWHLQMLGSCHKGRKRSTS